MQRLTQDQKHLRLDQTAPEIKLWSCLRARRCGGIKFRRQVPIGRYVVDFFCVDLGLVIEVDGDDHARRVKSDARRTAFLKSLGYRVIRFGNPDVMQNIYGVVDQVLSTATEIQYKEKTM